MTSFYGYHRPDGSVGIRNVVGLISVMDNVNPITRAIQSNVANTLAVTTLFVRGQYGRDGQIAFDTLIGQGCNPNLAAVLVIGLERTTTELVTQGIAKSGKPTDSIVTAELGSIRAIAEGIHKARRLVIETSALRRTAVPASALTIGVECGGSDTTSGLAANPVLGIVADRIVADGGRVVISETSEFLGAEDMFAERAVDDEVRRDFLGRVRELEGQALRRGVDIRGANPVPDNIRGGLTTIEEKAIGAMAKSGSSALVGVLSYGQRPQAAGLHFMDTPAPAVESMTGLASGGVQAILFATGVGNTIGNAVAPTIKVTANKATLARLGDDIDFDASSVLDDGGKSAADVGGELYRYLLEVASGTYTSSEVLKQQETAISRFEPSI